jgi:hypothetical protein
MEQQININKSLYNTHEQQININKLLYNTHGTANKHQ